MKKILVALVAALALVFGGAALPASAAKPVHEKTYNACNANEVSIAYAGTDVEGHNTWRLTSNGTDVGPDPRIFKVQFVKDGAFLGQTFVILADGASVLVTSPVANGGSTEWVGVTPGSAEETTAAGCTFKTGPGSYAVESKGNKR